MTPQSNKNIINQLAKTFSTPAESNAYYEEVRSLDETQDLIFLLNQNLNSVTQAEKRLSFMIGEVRSTVKKRI
jgi:hypothetical protein